MFANVRPWICKFAFSSKKSQPYGSTSTGVEAEQGKPIIRPAQCTILSTSSPGSQSWPAAVVVIIATQQQQGRVSRRPRGGSSRLLLPAPPPPHPFRRRFRRIVISIASCAMPIPIATIGPSSRGRRPPCRRKSPPSTTTRRHRRRRRIAIASKTTNTAAESVSAESAARRRRRRPRRRGGRWTSLTPPRRTGPRPRPSYCGPSSSCAYAACRSS